MCPMTFATDLKQARQAAGLTQAELSARLQVSPQTLRNWESGRTEPPDTPVITKRIALDIARRAAK